MSLITIQPLIDNFHLILAGIGFCLWSLAQVVTAKAKADPATNKWDELSPQLTWASRLYSQALDWLADTKHLTLGPNQTKLGELNKLVQAFEGKVAAGKYLEAINDVVGYWTAARSKIAAPVIPPTVPATGDQMGTISNLVALRAGGWSSVANREK